MIARVEKIGDYWTGYIEENGEVLLRTGKLEPRPGCAIRTLLNTWQRMHGTTNMTFEININDW